MQVNFETIRTCLADLRREHLPADNRTRAAVAMILRQCERDLEVLLIQRASHDLDPWSGHLAFPGGKVEPGEEPRQAAERETEEEVGLILAGGSYLGYLGEFSASTLPVRVSGYVYGISGCEVVSTQSGEVHDAFWIGFNDLFALERQITATVNFGGGTHGVPAISMGRPDMPALWGLTYRLIMQFRAICISDF